MGIVRMEPLAHTLAGACLAESGLKRLTPLASSTLIIAANIPDVDGACYLHSADVAFALRRGWTHGVLAIAALPFALTAAMVIVDRLIARRYPERPRAKPLVLLGLAALGVLSHAFLDWLNNYGVRLLMPFSDRWFYGDTLFIVDPWLWLILGGAVMLAWTTHTRGLMTAVAFGGGTTALMLLAPVVPEWARAVWMAGLAMWALTRARVGEPRLPVIATGALALAGFYIAAMYAGTRIAERQVRELARARGWAAEQVAAMPVPAEPLRRSVIVVAGDRYLFVPVTWTVGPAPGIEATVFARGAHDAAVDAALSAPFVQGVRRWLRFPSYEVLPLPNGGRRVVIRDARFAIGNRPGFGVVAVVDLDAALTPRPGPDLAD
ncbi:MAG TPA: metal-dependent hydrolase [Vicinamibacterales bacterium]|nr:metal-dependent hydrolase [Vicinamibacterales bacterium]